MSRITTRQQSLLGETVAHVHATELESMSQVLDALKCDDWVTLDLLQRGVSATLGRHGMTGEQVLRAMICKQMKGLSYDALAFHLADSQTYRRFCRIGFAAVAPSASTLQRNIKSMQASTCQRINLAIVGYARAHKIEEGQRVRCDSTVIESAIHDPTDSSLLVDCVRVLTRLGQRANELSREKFPNHLKRARRRGLAIQHTASAEKRRPLYWDLLGTTAATVAAAHIVVDKWAKWPKEMMDIPALAELDAALRHTLALTAKVTAQTQRRVFDDSPVAAVDKVVSIFEPHTDIIRKDRRDTLYGHKTFITTGASGLIIDCTSERGNPADSSLATQMMQRASGALGRVPEQVAFDGGFSSRANLVALKELGIRDVAFSKSPGLAIKEMVKRTWLYQGLRNFRAGIESTISFLKRCFGWRRCTWRSFSSFQAYTWASVIACNLLTIARH